MSPPIAAVTLERVIAAPRDLVFRAWAEPHRLAQWWGPHGFTSPVCEVDLRAGGELRIHMQAPDGATHRMVGHFTEVEPGAVIAFDSVAMNVQGDVLLEGHTRVVFEGAAAGTRLTVVSTAIGSAAAEPHMRGMEAGWSQSLEKLAAMISETRV